VFARKKLPANYGLNRLGSVTAVTRSDGTLANSYVYRPYGELAASTGTVSNPFRYTGAYFDDATGWYQMGQRYYHQPTGRFTQLDPLPESILDINRYAYAGCNPVKFVDPTGLDHTLCTNGWDALREFGQFAVAEAQWLVAIYALLSVSNPGFWLAAGFGYATYTLFLEAQDLTECPTTFF
jgi:RHS repeat-associated protein